MTVTRKRRLRKRQYELMQERSFWERMQTAFSHNLIYYKRCECKMQELDEKAEEIRFTLEMGCSE